MEELKNKFMIAEGKHGIEMEVMKEELKLKSKSIHEQTNEKFEDIKLKLQKLKTLQEFKKENAKTAIFVTMKDVTEDITTNTILKFTNAKTNIGDGYHSETGEFTAPAAGLYEFNASFITNGAKWLQLNLLKNGELVARGHAHMSHGSTGTLNAILLLQKGDLVYLRHPRSVGSIYGEEYSMFSGHQL
ncbi:heavy metal-binding protein HIP-like [Mytilus edulis]|uniref:heavy metal-binding protein HIP-like n=1 Tax=Mytilus edulis TaxID=6550 RepID=UPI0039F08B3B